MWFKKMLAERRERQRKAILNLIGRDIEDIARDAYNEGCYVTTRQMQAAKLIEFQCLMAENEKLREVAIKQYETMMPEIKIMAEKLNPNE